MLPLAALAVALILLAACDGSVNYTVINGSGQTLFTRVSDEPCSQPPSYKGDLSVEEQVPADGILEYDDVVSWLFDGQCVQVYTAVGELVLAETYEYSGSYHILANPSVIGQVETTERLPNQGWWDNRKEEWTGHPVQFFLMSGFVLLFLGGMAYGVVLGIKALLPRKPNGGA